MKAKPEIFKQYDIRGIYPSEINEKIARQVGGVFAGMLNKKRRVKIVVGRDARKSSRPLTENFIAGAAAAGAEIFDIGVVITPMLYFAVHSLGTDGGAMITASHNPLKYNGIKMTKKDGLTVSGEEIKKEFSKKIPKKKKGEIKKYDIKNKYFNASFKKFRPIKNIKISLSASGSPKFFLPELYKKLGLKESKRPDFSASFDYDGDRLIISNGKGKIIRGDIIGLAVGDAVARRGDLIIYDLTCSRSVPEYFRNKGVRTLPGKIGHANIKKTMREKGAQFGMEMTGHYYFKKFNDYEAPFYALRKFIEYLSYNRLKISDLEKIFSKYSHSGVVNINANSADFKKIIENLKREYSHGAQNMSDGLTIEFSSWWFNIRKSNTEPVFRLVVEASNQKTMEERKEEILGIIKKSI